MPHINSWMKTIGIKKGDYKGVVRWYLDKLQTVAKSTGKRGIVWQEAFDHYGIGAYPPATDAPRELKHDTLIHMWYSPTWYDPPTGLPVGKTLDEVVQTGRSVLVSFPWCKFAPMYE